MPSVAPSCKRQYLTVYPSFCPDTDTVFSQTHSDITGHCGARIMARIMGKYSTAAAAAAVYETHRLILDTKKVCCVLISNNQVIYINKVIIMNIR